jgi:hypothetical protein
LINDDLRQTDEVKFYMSEPPTPMADGCPFEVRVESKSPGSRVSGAVSEVGDSPIPSSRSKLPQSDEPTDPWMLVELAAEDVTTKRSESLVCDPPMLLEPLSPYKNESSEQEDDPMTVL